MKPGANKDLKICPRNCTSSVLFNEHTLASNILRKLARKILTNTDMLRYFLAIFRKILLATARSQIFSSRGELLPVITRH